MDPDKLTRETPGTYRTADKRFEVRQTGVGWYLVDLERANELGQELLHGPFPTLKEARDEIPDARKVVQLAGPKPRVAAGRVEKKAAAAPKTWIDRLPAGEQSDVRRLIAAVERAGVPDAEEVVKSARSSTEPVIAAALVEQKLKELIDEADPEERRSRRDLVRRVLAIIADEGELTRAPLPGWELVETGGDREKPRRLRPSV
jgi:hypothetical protein